MDPLGDSLWSGSDQLSAYQTTLTSLEGCITQSELATYESYVSGSSSRRRRRLAEVTASDDSDQSWKTFRMNLTDVDTLAYPEAKQVWGSTGNEWWGNLSDTLCDTSQFDDPYGLPNAGSLLLKVDKSNMNGDNGTELIGFY